MSLGKAGGLVDSWGFAVGVAAAVHLVAALLPLRPSPEPPLEFIDIELAEPIVEPPPPPAPEPEPEPPPEPELPPGELNDRPEADPTKTSVASNRPAPADDAEPAPLVTGMAIDAEGLVDEGMGMAVRVGNTDAPGFDAPGVAPEDIQGFTGEGRGGGGTQQSALSGVDDYQAPRVVRDVVPPYPKGLKREGIEGEVVLRVQVLANGRAGKVDLIRASHPEFAESALATVHRFRWRPARIGKQKVEGWTRLTIRFELTGQGP